MASNKKLDLPFAAFMLAGTALVGTCAVDKSGDLSLQITFDIDRETSSLRQKTEKAIQDQFQTAAFSPLATHHTPADKVEAYPLPTIINNNEAQQAASACQESNQRDCASQITEKCLQYPPHDGMIEFLKQDFSAKLHRFELRTCSVKHQECEKQLASCVKRTVLPLAGNSKM